MSDARKCDQCGEFFEMPPAQYTVLGAAKEPRFRLVETTTYREKELDVCSLECLAAFAASEREKV